MLYIKERNNLIMVQGVWWPSDGATDSMGSTPVYVELVFDKKHEAVSPSTHDRNSFEWDAEHEINKHKSNAKLRTVNKTAVAAVQNQS